ncbi:agarase [Mangrovibacterium sp.]|uniref:agarase n=1 Tax=Mangrovibacterium sp. TaxID=1961364 RepID=UPI0035649CB1
MKNNLIYLTILLTSCLTSCSNAKNEDQYSQQQYILVDAKVRHYNQDGTRTYGEYQPFKTRTIDLLSGYVPRETPIARSKYGGRTDSRLDSTGFFRVEKIDGRWWAVDPDGYLYFNVALNSINAGKSSRSQQALKDKFDTKENWMKETIDLLHENGFNCAGSWSDEKLIIETNKKLDRPMAYCINWNFMASYGHKRGGTYQQPGHTGYPNDAIFVFDPEFASFCDEHAKQLVAYKDDPNLFGYFSDNEMPFKFNAIDNYLSLPEGDRGRMAAESWLKDQGIGKEQITDKHREIFMALVADKYFSTVAGVIKKYDPNHLYIGARFYSDEKNQEEFMKVAGKYLDIISNNYYNYWTPDSVQMANWATWTGKPFIVTEYYTKGEDSGMGNSSGAGWIVRTQKDRGLFYQNYNLALIESKNCVGWHYFKYQDNDPTAKGVDPSNVDANKGIVNNEYELWKPMMDEMKELNTQVYNVIDYFDKN